MHESCHYYCYYCTSRACTVVNLSSSFLAIVIGQAYYPSPRAHSAGCLGICEVQLFVFGAARPNVDLRSYGTSSAQATYQPLSVTNRKSHAYECSFKTLDKDTDRRNETRNGRTTLLVSKRRADAKRYSNCQALFSSHLSCAAQRLNYACWHSCAVQPLKRAPAKQATRHNEPTKQTEGQIKLSRIDSRSANKRQATRQKCRSSSWIC